LWGKVLVRVFQLHSGTSVFLAENPSHLPNCLTTTTWLQQLAQLADIFKKKK
jgi:hypothetical protein